MSQTHSVTIPLLSNIDLYGPTYISIEYLRLLVYSGGGGAFLYEECRNAYCNLCSVVHYKNT